MLLTRAPLVSEKASFSLLPFDLHVLGLPLAFILSQDQTLRCEFLFNSRLLLFSFFSHRSFDAQTICQRTISRSIFPSYLSVSIPITSSKGRAKVRKLFLLSANFFEVFFSTHSRFLKLINSISFPSKNVSERGCKCTAFFYFNKPF